jgi:glycosyltransferase involved in cell wall biosynthesis
MNSDGPRLGIGIVTFNRLAYLKKVLASVREKTTGQFEIVVADDGSTDGTKEFLRAEGVRCVTGQNRGVCWNKNRALIALETLNCDPILLLEDDCHPVERGWDVYWRTASAMWGHVCYAHPKLSPWIISGSGRPDDPIVNQKATAQCASASAELLRKIGYYDTRFKGYGVGHAEWTTRAKKAGFGFRRVTLENGQRARANLFITGGLVADDAPTFKDKATILRNEKLFEQIKHESLYRFPWSTPAQKFALEMELREAGLSNNFYFGENPATLFGAGEDPAFQDLLNRLAQSKTQRRLISRVFSDSRSPIVRNRWVETLATNVASANGEFVPAFSYGFLKFLASREGLPWRRWRVMEIGSGYSTAWWSRRVADVVSMERDEDRLKYVAKLVSENVNLVHSRDGLIGSSVFGHRKFDIVAADARESQHLIVADVIERLSSTGVVLLNFEGSQVDTGMMVSFKTAGFRSIPFEGFAPAATSVRTTVLLYRDANIFDI